MLLLDVFFSSFKVKGIFVSLFQSIILCLYNEIGFNAAEENTHSSNKKYKHFLIKARQTHLKEHLTKYQQLLLKQEKFFFVLCHRLLK
jgi:hypothetical protein